MKTIAVPLTTCQTLFETYWHKMMGTSVISVISVFILFVFIQKYLVKGLNAGGVKE